MSRIIGIRCNICGDTLQMGETNEQKIKGILLEENWKIIGGVVPEYDQHICSECRQEEEFTCEGCGREIYAKTEDLEANGWVKAEDNGRPVYFCHRDCKNDYFEEEKPFDDSYVPHDPSIIGRHNVGRKS